MCLINDHHDLIFFVYLDILLIYNYRCISNSCNKFVLNHILHCKLKKYDCKYHNESQIVCYDNSKNIQLLKLNNYTSLNISDILCLSAYCGNISLVKFCINNKKYNTPDTVKITAITYAAANGHLNIVKYLINNGIDVKCNDNICIRVACIHNHFNLVKYLIKCGADYRIWNDYCFKNAIIYNRRDVIDVLIDCYIKNGGYKIKYIFNFIHFYTINK